MRTSKSKNFLVSLRLGICIVFMSIFLTITVVIVFFTSISFYRALTFLANNFMTSTTTALSRELFAFLSPMTPFSKLSSSLIESKLIDNNDFVQLIKYSQDLLKLLPQIEMIHWGDKNGNFIIAQRKSDGNISTIYFNKDQLIPETALIYRHVNNNIIQTRLVNNQEYDPRERPWYIIGEKTGHIVWSNVFLFLLEDKRGMSISIPIYHSHQLEGVFSIELRLNAFSNFLNQHKISENSISFIVDNNDHIIAAQQKSVSYIKYLKLMREKKISSLSNTPLYKAYFYFEKTKKYNFMFESNKETYLANFSKIPQFYSYQWYVVSIVPINDFIGNLKKFNMLILFLLSIIFFIGLLLLSYFSKKISVPFNRLSKEFEKIKIFKINPSPKTKTLIKEVFTISEAIESMKIGLSSFKKYVPENLVRQLMLTGEDARVGGVNRKIVMFFSDITDFTPTAEKLSAKIMMANLCQYFDEMTKIIAQYQGTIDKYIGDAILAFWGAPFLDVHSIQHACYAVLKCQERLHHLANEKKSYAFNTRIGLHFGEAVVGNLGSSERMNYTVIGPAVSIANQLEQINKFYGTKIIVSEDVKRRVSDQFVFRILDKIIVNNEKSALFIYELIGTKEEAVDPTILDFCELYYHAFSSYQHQDWDIAIKYFEKVQRIKPEDFASHIMINRCKIFKKNPPIKNWNGTWIFVKKNTKRSY